MKAFKDKGQHLSNKLIEKNMWRSDGAKFSLPESGDDSSEDSNVRPQATHPQITSDTMAHSLETRRHKDRIT